MGPSIVLFFFSLTIHGRHVDTVSIIITFPRRVFIPCKAAKESSVKRRQLIDATNYHFNMQFKKYKAEHHPAQREDSWTRDIISKVHCEHFVLPPGGKFNGPA